VRGYIWAAWGNGPSQSRSEFPAIRTFGQLAPTPKEGRERGWLHPAGTLGRGRLTGDQSLPLGRRRDRGSGKGRKKEARARRLRSKTGARGPGERRDRAPRAGKTTSSIPGSKAFARLAVGGRGHAPRQQRNPRRATGRKNQATPVRAAPRFVKSTAMSGPSGDSLHPGGAKAAVALGPATRAGAVHLGPRRRRSPASAKRRQFSMPAARSLRGVRVISRGRRTTSFGNACRLERPAGRCRRAVDNRPKAGWLCGASGCIRRAP